MALLEASFVRPADRGMLRDVGALVLREWGSHAASLVDCATYYTLLADELRGPAITEPPCVSNIDLRLACTVVERWPGRVRDFRLVWNDATLRAEFDLYKDGTRREDLCFPGIEWREYDATVFERRLEETGVSFRTMPHFWSDIQPMLKAVATTVLNKAQFPPVFDVTLGVEEEEETCYLTFGNMDTVSYAVLERIAEQSHIVDINVRAFEKRLDVRVKLGSATPWPLRSLPRGKRTSISDTNDDNEKRARHT